MKSIESNPGSPGKDVKMLFMEQVKENQSQDPSLSMTMKDEQPSYRKMVTKGLSTGLAVPDKPMKSINLDINNKYKS